MSTFFFCTTLLIVLGFMELRLYWISVIFFVIYFVYVLVVVFMEVKDKKSGNVRDFGEEDADNREKSLTKALNENSKELISGTEKSDDFEDGEADAVDQSAPTGLDLGHKEMNSNAFGKFWHRYIENMNEKWEEKNIAEKVLYIVEYPFHLLM